MKKVLKMAKKAKVSPKAKPKADAKPGPEAKALTKAKQAPLSVVEARLVPGPIPYLEVIVREQVTEQSMVALFEFVRGQVGRLQAKRVLVDMREGSVFLTISDMLGLAKLVATTFAGVLERFAILVRPQDLLAEKFFEPSVSSRGLPTLATSEVEEAVYWITSKLRQVR